jgi:membrane-associated protein
MNPLDAASLLGWLGHWAVPGIFLVLFAETGLLVGFLLPGDSLLLTAGLVCAAGTGPAHLSLPWVLVAASAGALAGAQVGFLLGRRAGRALLARSRSRQIGRAAARAESLLLRVGIGPALIAARFTPVVRTVIGPTAGMAAVPAHVYLLWQTVGGLLWTVGTTMVGYALGRTVPGIGSIIDPLIAATALLLPALFVARLIRERRAVARARRTGAE